MIKLHLATLTIQTNLFHVVDLFNLPISKVWVVCSTNFILRKEIK
ncbi:hypothetical protein HMPREF1426_00540 [Helicobacter pylori GAM80Ai]|nr:hypothetical protein HMPREF1426_00540 [Helicobacter pylori GAM80Ai]